MGKRKWLNRNGAKDAKEVERDFRKMKNVILSRHVRRTGTPATDYISNCLAGELARRVQRLPFAASF